MTEQPPEPGQQPPQNPYASSPSPAHGATGASGLPLWAPDHPQASTVLILGILGLAMCPVIAPFGWVIGSRVKKEVDAPGSQYGGRSQVQVGYILGIVGTCLLGLYVLGTLAYVALVAIAVSAGA